MLLSCRTEQNVPLRKCIKHAVDNTLKSVAIHPYTQTTAHYILDHPKVDRCFQIRPLGAICKVNERLSFLILEKNSDPTDASYTFLNS